MKEHSIVYKWIGLLAIAGTIVLAINSSYQKSRNRKCTVFCDNQQGYDVHAFRITADGDTIPNIPWTDSEEQLYEECIEECLSG